MFNKLVFSIVSYWAAFANVWFIVSVASFMIFAVSNGGESLVADLADVGLLTGVGSHVNEKVSFLSEYLSAVGDGAVE